MRRRVLPTLIGIALALAGADASATLIDFGSFTRDTNAGLDWLDVTLTQNRSANVILAGWGGYVEAGWAYATEFQLCGLFGALGDPISNCPGPVGDSIEPGSAATFISLLGQTGSIGTYGIYDSGHFGANVGLGCIDGSSAGCGSNANNAATFTSWGGMSTSFSVVGSFLVRVPEPTTALLVACGLVGLGVRRRLH
jgi:hypothetical protein